MKSNSPSPNDDGRDVRLHSSRLVRVLLVAAGLLSLSVGIVGIMVPVLPTVPFLLLAAACFARASDRLYCWLDESTLVGPHLREWRRHRSIARRTKLTALVMMGAGFSVSIIFFVDPYWLKGLLTVVAIGLGLWLYRIPSRDSPDTAR